MKEDIMYLLGGDYGLYKEFMEKGTVDDYCQLIKNKVKEKK